MGVAGAPLWLIFVTQLASVAGDALGQRCSRVYHNRSRRRFVLSMVVVTAVQMTVALFIIQLAFPGTATQLTKSVNGTKVDVCSLPEGDPDRGSNDECYAQGPITLYRAVWSCPILLIDGFVNVFYYIGEASMYRESLGVMLIVMAALSSTFIVAPLQDLLDLGNPKQAAPAAIALGVIGAILCTVERSVTVKATDDQTGSADELSTSSRVSEIADGEDGAVTYGTTEEGSALVAGGATGPTRAVVEAGQRKKAQHGDGADPNHLQEPLTDSYDERCEVGEDHDHDHLAGRHNGQQRRQRIKGTDGHEDDEQAALVPSRGDASPTSEVYVDESGVAHTEAKTCKGRAVMVWGVVKQYLPLLAPFFGLSFAYALYFVLMLYYDDKCSINPFGFNAFDQGALPFYVFPLFALMDIVPGLRLEHEDDAKDQRIHTAFFRSVREDSSNYGIGFLHMFMYRLLINGRAISYNFIVVEYDLARSYLELTLVRVLLSWLISFVIVIGAPRFIQADEEERAKVKDKVNLVAKVLGSLAVVGSLIIMKYA